MRKRLLPAIPICVLLSHAAWAGEIVYVEDISGRDSVSTYSAAELAEKRAQVDAYATKSMLAVFREGGPDEIRFWISWANFDPGTIGYETKGYVISNQGLWVCRIAYRQNEHSPVGGSCKASSSKNTKTILAELGSLSKLSGKSLSCGVMDGEWMSVDGVFAGQRFTFSSSNPDMCPGKGSKLVAKVLRDVRQ
ncbi:MAG TPA: hypothetical protein PKE27_14860 [Povalibacter sp.]|uniref:hypothetical protein n=1 Tax=Povalibacter sp. TaxID=1962978 RepID=UPI002BCF37C2|nr:hypothetical protein [Povalibacter sp.]HMN45856.1 hypothetical protein [Povalibacter sp.]